MVSFIALALMAAPSAQASEVLTRYDALLCGNTGALGPGPGEEGHLAAARLATLNVPFTVTHVKARLHNGPAGNAQCDGSLPRTIMVWKSESETPDASPQGAVSISFEAEEVLGEIRTIEGALPTPIELNVGDYLWASIDFGGTYPNVGCVKTCRADSVPGVHFWSGADSAPYSWTDLAGTGAEGALWLDVLGESPTTPRSDGEPAAEQVDPAPEPAPEPARRGRR